MTESDFEKLLLFRHQIDEMRMLIESCTAISSIRYDSIRGFKGDLRPTEDRALKLIYLEEKYNKILFRYTVELYKATEYIEQIPDAEIQCILFLRYFQGLTWQEISNQLKIERTTCAKIIKRYFNSTQ